MSKPPKKWTKWIPHTGDECPVDGDEAVRVKLKCGKTSKAEGLFKAGEWCWGTVGPGMITHYKRLRANVLREAVKAIDINHEIEKIVESDARTSKLSDKFDKAPPEPTPIITGQGEYKTRDREKVTIYRQLSSTSWVGNFPHRKDGFKWRETGEYLTSEHPIHDIIGPWEEPEAEAEPEMWVNVYPPEDGGSGRPVVYSVYSSKAIATSMAGDDSIGTFKLTKGEEA